ncbi:MAG: hypothetical protein ACSLFE_11175 [Gemmatimonadaceae bacterium]
MTADDALVDVGGAALAPGCVLDMCRCPELAARRRVRNAQRHQQCKLDGGDKAGERSATECDKAHVCGKIPTAAVDAVFKDSKPAKQPGRCNSHTN